MAIKSEQAFDMLPHVVSIYEKLDLKAAGKQLTAEVKKEQPELSSAELQSEVGEKMILYVIKNAPRIKDEFFGIVAIACGISVEEAKARGLVASLQAFKDIFTDKELWAFFKGAVQ